MADKNHMENFQKHRSGAYVQRLGFSKSEVGPGNCI